MINLSFFCKCHMVPSIDESKKKKQVELKGILVPESWDSSNKVVRVAICTSGEKEYIIEKNNKGEELLRYSGLKAVIRGILKDKGIKKKSIIVENYEIHSW